MREIKFQLVWKHEDKIVKETVSLDHLLKNNPTAPRFSKGKLRVAAELIAKRQYTGVRDIEGVEIFEGDIVEVDGEVCVVDFDGGAFAVDVRGYDYDYTAVGWTEAAIEVIGNIHQNPELLEK